MSSRVERLLLAPQGDVTAGYARLFNLVEMTAVFGPLDARVAAVGVVAILCHGSRSSSS